MIKSNAKLIQVASLVISSVIGISLNIIIGFVIPNVITYEDFSAYKIYTFYLGFIPILHLGITDGILINYSKYNVEELKRINFKKSLIVFSIFQAAMTIIIVFTLINTINLNIYHLFVLLTIPLVNISGYVIKVLVLCNKFKVISIFNLFIKISTVLALCLMLITEYKNFYVLIYATMLAYLAQIVIGYIIIKKEIFFDSSLISENIRFKKVIKIGFPIVIAYFIATLLLGLDRIFIERTNNIYEYAMYAFAYSLITIFITVLDSISVFIFPTVMKMEQTLKVRYYQLTGKIIDLTMGVMSILIVLMIPVTQLVIPKYFDSLTYFYLLFPVIFLRLHYSLRMWPHLNSLTKSKTILYANSIICIFSFLLNSVIFYYDLSFIYYAISTVISLLLLNIYLDAIVKKFERVSKKFSSMYQILIILLMFFTYHEFNEIKFIIFTFINISLIYIYFFVEIKMFIKLCKKRIKIYI